MATAQATKRLMKEYKNIVDNPPPYIVAHPSQTNILEWHYIITGPADTPYEKGQYWGTLVFPPTYPFAPPAIRMYTPSGRFEPGQRICLSISDFHPKSFNPAWEVSTILNGLLSFMTGNENTTGSVRESDQARRAHALRSRWWNSTGGGDLATPPSVEIDPKKAQGSGAKFRTEFPQEDFDNWWFIERRNINPHTGRKLEESVPDQPVRKRATVADSAAESAEKPGEEKTEPSREGWVSRNRYYIGLLVFLGYGIVSRLLAAA